MAEVSSPGDSFPDFLIRCYDAHGVVSSGSWLSINCHQESRIEHPESRIYLNSWFPEQILEFKMHLSVFQVFADFNPKLYLRSSGCVVLKRLETHSTRAWIPLMPFQLIPWNGRSVIMYSNTLYLRLAFRDIPELSNKKERKTTNFRRIGDFYYKFSLKTLRYYYSKKSQIDINESVLSFYIHNLIFTLYE